MIKLFNTDSIWSAKGTIQTAPSGFRYGFISNLFREDVYEELLSSFPAVETFKLVDKQSGGGRKRFYQGSQYDSDKNRGCVCHLERLPKIWKDVLRESASPEFMTLLSESTGLQFNSLNVFGFTFGNEGCMQEAHLDGVIRDNPIEIKSPIACLLYFNEKPDDASGTCVYAPDKKTVLFQAPHMRNGLFFFQQHPDAWHGFPVMPAGTERRVISLAYNREKEPVHFRESLIHKATCIPGLKQRIKFFLGK